MSLWARIKNHFIAERIGPAGMQQIPKMLSEADQRKRDEALLQQGTCPSCMTPEAMRLGPEGGSAQNCMCIACREEFNLAFLGGVVLLDRMGKASPDRARSLYGWEADTTTTTH